MVQDGDDGVMVWGMVFLPSLDPLMPQPTVPEYSSCPCPKDNTYTSNILINWFLKHETIIYYTQMANPIKCLMVEVEWKIYIKKLLDAVMSQ